MQRGGSFGFQTCASASSTRPPSYRAVLNALSAMMMREKGIKDAKVLKNADALDVIEIKKNDNVAMVGAFVPFIKTLKGRTKNLSIIDKHPQALKEDERRL